MCKNWNSVTSDKADIWVPETLWLVTNEHTNLKYTLHNIIHQRDFKMSKETMNNTFITRSCKGWLIVLSDDQVYVVNLFSKDGYMLPPRDTNEYLVLSSFVFTISTCVNLNPIVVVGLTRNKTLFWCTLGDMEWKDYKNNDHDDGEKYGNVAFLNDQLYAIREKGNVIDVFGVDSTQPYLIPLRTVLHATTPTKRPSELFDLYLVESKGNILVVIRYCDESNVDTMSISGVETIDFEIFKSTRRCASEG